MKPSPSFFPRVLALSGAVAVLAGGGCHLDRHVLGGAWSTISPMQACPGETVVASYDFLREETCRDEAACRSHHPTVVISSSPEAFPVTAISGYSGEISFVPVADSTTVLFDIDRDAVRIPTTRTDADGTRIDVVRDHVLDASGTVAVLSGMIEQELVHEGMCAGATPVNASAELPGPPRWSANLLLQEVCNVNAVPVSVTLSGTPMDGSLTHTLMPGQCLDPDPAAWDVTPDIRSARVVGIRPLVADPGVRCVASDAGHPPATLRSIARLSCS